MNEADAGALISCQEGCKETKSMLRENWCSFSDIQTMDLVYLEWNGPNSEDLNAVLEFWWTKLTTSTRNMLIVRYSKFSYNKVPRL